MTPTEALSLALSELHYSPDIMRGRDRQFSAHRRMVWRRMSGPGGLGISQSATARACGFNHSSVSTALSRSEAPPPPPSTTEATARITTLCAELRVSLSDVCGRCRDLEVVRAREVIVDRLREETTLSYPQIGRLLCRGNHSTVVTAHQRYKARKAEVMLPAWEKERRVNVLSLARTAAAEKGNHTLTGDGR